MTTKRTHSIRRKLTAIIMLTSMAAVLLAFVGFVFQDIIDSRRDLDEDLNGLGAQIAANSNAALTFGDRSTAKEVLSVLATKGSVFAGCIYTDADVPFATYYSARVTPLPHNPRSFNGVVRVDRTVEFFRPIMRDGERVGTLYIASDLRELHGRLTEDAQFMAVILLVCMIASFFLSSRLQARISEPIVELARVAGVVSEQKDYTVRADPRVVHASDEIDHLVTGFNGMLAEIERRDDELLLHQTHLEDMVALRTGELTTANEKLSVAKRAAEKVAEINERLARESALILNSATDGIVGMDNDGEPSFLNPAGARMLGRSLSDLQGKSIHSLIHHSRADGTPLPAADCTLGQALLRGEPFEVSDDIFWRKDGSSFPVEYSSTPMRDEGGNKLGAVLMFRDVTERRMIERLKSEFVSTVSHELRTPLTSIRGALGLLSSGLLGPFPEKGQRMLEIAVTNTDRLVRLINDILDLERIQSGKVELDRGRVDAKAIMEQAADGLQAIADQAGVRIVVEPTTATLWGDSDRIIQTLTNLIGNAIKFSPADTTVTVSGVAGETEFTFSIADQGRGIPEQKLETIFERFSQVDASDSRDKGGSGLGLAICQSIVNAHGGRIWAERNEPAGSRFRFTIPLAIAPAVAATSSEGARGRTVLVCQGDSSSGVVETLERRGFCVVTVASSADIVSDAVRTRPDAIIFDVKTSEVTGGGSGLDLVDALRSNEATRDIPIVVATSQSPESYESYAPAVASRTHKALQSDDLMQALALACGTSSILIVEDDLDLARVLTTAIEGHGIRTFHAVRGSEAVRLCRQHEPSLIVLDLILPDMDGFAVVSALRESATLRRVPLLVYSALDVRSADQSRLRLGPTEFLTKSRSSLADFEGHVVRLLEAVTHKETEEPHHVA